VTHADQFVFGHALSRSKPRATGLASELALGASFLAKPFKYPYQLEFLVAQNRPKRRLLARLRARSTYPVHGSDPGPWLDSWLVAP